MGNDAHTQGFWSEVRGGLAVRLTRPGIVRERYAHRRTAVWNHPGTQKESRPPGGSAAARALDGSIVYFSRRQTAVLVPQGPRHTRGQSDQCGVPASCSCGEQESHRRSTEKAQYTALKGHSERPDPAAGLGTTPRLPSSNRQTAAEPKLVWVTSLSPQRSDPLSAHPRRCTQIPQVIGWDTKLSGVVLPPCPSDACVWRRR